jgi:hypothetical protein
MMNAIAAFQADAQQIIDSFKTGLESSYQAPSMVYHYTNDAGLRGILQGGRMWLTDIFSLNDPSELRHGLSRVQAILSQKAASGPPESKIFAKDFASLGKGLERTAHTFMCSLSEADEDLGQWRAYADNGRGYALGFDTTALEEAFHKNTKAPTSERATFPVTYRDSVLDDIQRRLIEKIFSLISLPNGRHLPGDVIVAYMLELLTALASHALHAVLFFKHEAYKNEQEYRFLEMHRADAPPQVKRRPRAYSLVDYVESDWKTSAPGALKRIVIGPAADRQKAREFACECLREFGPANVQIDVSEIPYRAT